MDILELLLNLLFSHQIKIKILHFQTEYFARHKITDKYLKKFNKLFDSFFEVAQGIFGKLNVDKVHLSFKTANDTSIMNELENLVDTLKKLDRPFEKYTELLNIRDEMVENAEQFIYLLTFK